MPDISRITNSMIKTKILVFLIVFSGLMRSCITPKDARILKRTTKDWRESREVFHAYADTPFSGIFLILRENGKFEYTSSGLMESFQAGEWAINQDTIKLSFVNSQQITTNKQSVFFDRANSKLVFEGEKTSELTRWRIMKNKL
jgi:hypothetical protein